LSIKLSGISSRNEKKKQSYNIIDTLSFKNCIFPVVMAIGVGKKGFASGFGRKC